MRNVTIFLPLIPALASCSGDAPAVADKPLNIIYIMTDDHSYQTVSAYDSRYIRTPNLDRIAAQGITFDASFVANSISGPSRACLLTGKHSHLNSMATNATTFDSTQLTFPRLLKQVGYQTAMIGKWHLVSTPSSDFDYWKILPGQGAYYNPDFITPTGTERYNGYATEIITDMGIDYLESVRDKSKPFMMFLHHKAPHRNWMSDGKYLSEFEDVTFPVPSNYFDTYDGRASAAHAQQSVIEDMDIAYDLKMMDSDSPLKGWMGELARMTPDQLAAWNATYKPINEQFTKSKLAGKELAEWKFQRYIRDYLKCIRSVDDNVGRLLDYLESEGLMENTLIVYTSDQGFYMGEHGWFDKRFIYEESLRTPLMVRMPNSYKGERGIRTNKMVQNIDHASTFLDIAGITAPDEMQGLSYLPILQGKDVKTWRKSIYYHYYEYPDAHRVHKHYGVRTDDGFTLVHFYDNGIDSWELYDLKADPHQMVNIYGKADYAAKQAELHAELEKLRTQYKVTQ